MSELNEYEKFEIDALLEAIFLRYDYDFRHYAKASLRRRLRHHLDFSDFHHLSDLIPEILHGDPQIFANLLRDLSVSVTHMFRDPYMFRAFREKVIPVLKTYPRINIWHAGCATGEEAYSTAIILHEEGLLEKARLYATDIDAHSLEVAVKGIYRADSFHEPQQAYLEAGGTGSLQDFYRKNYESVKMRNFLRERITFAHHNLVSDPHFADMHVIFCRNVMIYFDGELQNQVLEEMQQSLVRRGFFVLGDKESMDLTPVQNQFEGVQPNSQIYRKKKNHG